VPIASSNEIDSDAMSTLDLQCLCNLVNAVQAVTAGSGGVDGGKG